jgi:phosphatidate phosphatase LPIN
MTDLVDQMFPPIHRRWVQEYTDVNFWKPPIADIELPDLAPPSPALSARSDSSNVSALARLRSGFSLGGSGKPPHQRRATELAQSTRDDSLRRMVSYQHAGAGNVRDFARGASQDPDEERGDWRGVRRGGPRARSADSMPGSLPGSEEDTVWEDDEEEGEVEDEYEDNGEGDEDPMLETDEAFDEDVLAAGEMASVPFL